MAINKNASFVGTIEWRDSGRKVSFWISNTGETIVWQHVLDRPRASRITGRNLPRFAEELDVAINEGSSETTKS